MISSILTSFLLDHQDQTTLSISNISIHTQLTSQNHSRYCEDLHRTTPDYCGSPPERLIPFNTWVTDLHKNKKTDFSIRYKKMTKDT